MKLVIVGLAGSVALMGVSSLGIAQAPNQDEQPAARRAAPQPRAAPAPRAARPQVHKPAARVPTQRPAAQRAPTRRPTAVQRAPQKRAVERGLAQKKQRVEPNRGRQDGQARDRRAQDKLRQRQATPPVQRVSPKQVEKGLRRPDASDQSDRREQDKLRKQQATPPAQSGDTKQVGKGLRRPDAADKADRRAQPVARVQATAQQRREVRQGLLRQGNVQRIARNHLGIAAVVGNRVPRRHRLHRFTPALLAFAPLYAGYSYIVIDDTICVVDSESYAIVDVIEGSIESAGPPSSAPLPVLALSSEQMRLIYASVPKDRARTELRIRLALGAEISRSVSLFAFPDDLIAQVPQVAPFRYIVVENDVVIVDPADYEIAMVLSE